MTAEAIGMTATTPADTNRAAHLPEPGLPDRRSSGARPLGETRDRSESELLRACQQFEGLFLSILFRAMMKTTGSRDQGAYGTIAEQAFGQKLAEAGGIGLAKVLFDSLAKSTFERKAGG